VVAATVTAFSLGLSVAAAGASTKPSDTKKFCDAFKNNSLLNQQLFVAGPVGDAATTLNAELAAGVAAAKAVVPSAISAEYEFITSDSPTDITAITSAEETIDTWVLANCKYEVVKVAADNSSVKMPKTLKRGFVAFDIANNGAAGRFYGVVPLAPGETSDQLLATSLDQIRQRLIAQAQTAPGEETVAYGRITKPGVYVVLDGDSVGTLKPSYTSFTVKK